MMNFVELTADAFVLPLLLLLPFWTLHVKLQNMGLLCMTIVY